jgi:hypothetical protein
MVYVHFGGTEEVECYGFSGLLAGVAKKSKAAEYARLLGDCHITYCEARIGVVAPVARERIAAIGVQPLPAATRAGAAYLMQVGTCWMVVHPRQLTLQPGLTSGSMP